MLAYQAMPPRARGPSRACQRGRAHPPLMALRSWDAHAWCNPRFQVSALTEHGMHSPPGHRAHLQRVHGTAVRLQVDHTSFWTGHRCTQCHGRPATDGPACQAQMAERRAALQGCMQFEWCQYSWEADRALKLAQNMRAVARAILGEQPKASLHASMHMAAWDREQPRAMAYMASYGVALWHTCEALK